MYNEVKKREYLETLGTVDCKFATNVFDAISDYEEEVDADVSYMNTHEIKELIQNRQKNFKKLGYIKILQNYIKFVGREKVNYLTTSPVFMERFEYVTLNDLDELCKRIDSDYNNDTLKIYDKTWVYLLFYCGMPVESIVQIRLRDFKKINDDLYELTLHDNKSDRKINIPSFVYNLCYKMSKFTQMIDTCKKSYDISKLYSDGVFFVRSSDKIENNLIDCLANNIKTNRRYAVRKLNVPNISSINDIVLGGLLFSVKSEIIEKGCDYNIEWKKISKEVGDILRSNLDKFGLNTSDRQFAKYSTILKSYMINN